MSGLQEEKAYIRWSVPRLRGPPKAVTISRRNWILRMVAVLVILIAFAAFEIVTGGTRALLGVALVCIIAVVVAAYGWYVGRKGMA